MPENPFSLIKEVTEEEAKIVSSENPFKGVVAAAERMAKLPEAKVSKPASDINIPKEIADKNFFEGYYDWLHTPTEEAKGFWDFTTRVMPKSASGLGVGLAEFPYFAIKSFTDPIVKQAEDIVKGKEISELGLKYEIGKAAWELINGMAEFIGEPIGLYGWERLKKRWATDPFGATFALLPLARGARSSVRSINIPRPVEEFGQRSGNKLKRAVQKTYDALDLQAPFNRVGAEQTGIAAKKLNAIKEVEQQYAFGTAKGTVVERKLARKETIWDLKILPEEGEVVTRRAANSIAEVEVSPKINKAAKLARNYFDAAAERLIKDKALSQKWPKSAIDRNKVKIKELVEQDAKANSAKIAELKAENAQLSQVEYVPIDINIWYDMLKERLGESAADAAWSGATRNLYKGRFFHQRKTIDIGKLIDNLKEIKDPAGNPILAPQDFHINTIMAHYANKVGTIRGLAKIFNSAYKDGLIIRAKGLAPEGYRKPHILDEIRFPELKGKYINTAFEEWLARYHRDIGKYTELGRIMGYTKIMAFYNPFFLPAYDVWQQSWRMGINVPAYLKYNYKGVKSYLTKDKNFFEAAENGLFSTPYAPPFKNFVRDMMKTQEHRLAMRALDKVKGHVKNPALFVDDFYRVVWNMAWGGDGMVRMGTYFYNKAKGMTPQQAAQWGAYYHADYARLTPQARRVMNKIFFTPSFKFAMGHLQANMIKSSMKVLQSASRAKIPAERDLMLAKGLLMLVAGDMAKDWLMKRWGFRAENAGLRYVKDIETEEGDKELVLYWPDPNNVWLRQYHKWSKWGAEPDRLAQFMRKASWDLHPLWGLGVRTLANLSREHKVIWNPFDDGTTTAWRVGHNAVKEIVGAEGFIENLITQKGGKNAYKSLKKDLGQYHGLFLSAVTLAYLRKPENVRKAKAMKELDYLFKKYWRIDKPKTDETAEKRIYNFQERIRKLSEEMNK